MSYRHRIYRPDGSFWVSEFRDDDTRTITYYNEAGGVVSSRPYNAEESTAADAAALEDAAARNASTIETQAVAALAANKAFIAIAAPTNAQNATQIKALTRQMNGLIRLVLRRLDATD